MHPSHREQITDHVTFLAAPLLTLYTCTENSINILSNKTKLEYIVNEESLLHQNWKLKVGNSHEWKSWLFSGILMIFFYSFVCLCTYLFIYLLITFL